MLPLLAWWHGFRHYRCTSIPTNYYCIQCWYSTVQYSTVVDLRISGVIHRFIPLVIQTKVYKWHVTCFQFLDRHAPEVLYRYWTIWGALVLRTNDEHYYSKFFCVILSIIPINFNWISKLTQKRADRVMLPVSFRPINFVTSWGPQ